jgi:uncharacterized membrane protein YkoI
MARHEAYGTEEYIVQKKSVWIIAGAAAIVVLGGAGVAVAVTEPFEQDDRLTGETLDRATEAALAEVGEGTVAGAERSDDLDHAYSVEVRLDNGDDVDVELDEGYDVVRVDGVVPGSGGQTPSGSSDDATGEPGTPGADDTTAPIGAEERASAEKAALDHVGSGTVTDLDRSDDADHAWEVEVTGADGRDVDVELDASFAVVRVDADQ